MKLCDLLSIMGKYFDTLIEPCDSEVTNATRLITFLNAFTDDGDEKDNPIYSKKEGFLRKVYHGSEPLPADCARYYLSHLSSMAFDEFILDIDDSVMLNIIQELAYYDEVLHVANFADEFTSLLRTILNNIIDFPESRSIRFAEFIGNNKVKIGKKTLNLVPELTMPEECQPSENKYINALLEVYSYDTKSEIHSIEDLKNHYPKQYSQQLIMQRQYFYCAESVLRQIRDIFKDGIKEFNELKKETFEGVETKLLAQYNSGYEKINEVSSFVVIINYSRSFLSRPNNGLIGPNEKKGIIQMLVNDGRIEWLVNDDDNL